MAGVSSTMRPGVVMVGWALSGPGTSGMLPTVTLSGGTIDIGAAEVAGMTQGVNLLMFTEIASGHWLASRRSAS